jgi:beta-aspartyl-dipeptidase (metallo-type)
MEVAGAGSLAATLAELIELGRTLQEALPPFTSNVADILRLPAKGRVRTGCDADLVVLDDRGAVTDVMARGTWRIRNGAET